MAECVCGNYANDHDPEQICILIERQLSTAILAGCLHVLPTSSQLGFFAFLGLGVIIVTLQAVCRLPQFSTSICGQLI